MQGGWCGPQPEGRGHGPLARVRTCFRSVMRRMGGRAMVQNSCHCFGESKFRASSKSSRFENLLYASGLYTFSLRASGCKKTRAEAGFLAKDRSATTSQKVWRPKRRSGPILDEYGRWPKSPSSGKLGKLHALVKLQRNAGRLVNWKTGNWHRHKHDREQTARKTREPLKRGLSSRLLACHSSLTKRLFKRTRAHFCPGLSTWLRWKIKNG